MAKIFLSHSSRDGAHTERLVALLRNWGVDDRDVFLDYDAESGIVAGSSWERSLQDNLASARFVICVMTPNWLASEWCRAEYRTALLSGKSVIVYVAEPCDHGAFGASVQKILELDGQDQAAAKLERALAEAGFHPTRSLFRFDANREPFPGLRAFEEEDAALFFGRDAEIEALLERLSAARLDAAASRLHFILGASGSGKSSLLRAGVMPRLRRRQREWLLLDPLRPKQAQLRGLAEAIDAGLVRAGAASRLSHWLSAVERSAPAQFWSEVRQAFAAAAGAQEDGASARTLLCPIDQFEEALRVDDSAETARFADLLATATKSDADIVVVATIRTDSFHEYQNSVFGALAAPSLFSLPPLPAQEIASIIREPARVANIDVRPGLISRAARDAPTGDMLPLLAFTLNRLWRERGQDGALTEEDYDASGGIVGTIRSEWEAARRAARASDADMVAIYVPRLAGINLTGEYVRRRAKANEFSAREAPALDALVERRLLTRDGSGGDVYYDLPHEAVLRSLPQVSGALAERAQDISLIDKVEGLQRRLSAVTVDVTDSILLQLPARERDSLRELGAMPGWSQRLESVGPFLRLYDRRYGALAIFSAVLALLAVVVLAAFVFAPMLFNMARGYQEMTVRDPLTLSLISLAWVLYAFAVCFYVSFGRRAPKSARRLLFWSAMPVVLIAALGFVAIVVLEIAGGLFQTVVG